MATTAALRAMRGRVDQVHVVILFLLVVLGGSASGGRALGITLAVLGSALIDYFFQTPYDTLSVSKQLDVVVLVGFLTTAAVATHLLARARREADEARHRTDEARTLARLGADTLRHASSTAALEAIVALIRRTLGVSWCAIRPWSEASGLAAEQFESTDEARLLSPELGVQAASACATGGVAVAVSGDGSSTHVSTEPMEDVEHAPLMGARALLLPLRIEGRAVGVLGVGDTPHLVLDAQQRRFLIALAYYAAVAVERRALAAEAAHAAALREASRLKDRVLASVSHDLRTPLTTIKALAQSTAVSRTEEGVVIEEQVDRLARLVNDLLQLSRLRGHDLPMEMEENTAEDVLGAAVRQAAGIVGERRLALALDFRSAALTGRFDFVHTLRLIGNLIENALRFTPPGGTVEVGAHRDGGWLAFTVADRGPGVPPEERESIFDAFYRPPGAPADAGRAGLGLAIARELASAQGGTLTYTPREGGGSVFVLRLLATDVELADVDEPSTVAHR